MRPFYFGLLLSLVFLSASEILPAGESPTPLTAVHDLAATGAFAREHRLALLLAVTRTGCPYCALLKREILVPMIRSGEYDERVLIRELVMEPDSAVVDFNGERTSSAAIARRYDVGITPTVLLLDDRGRLLNPPLTGISTPEMYGYFLDRAIDAARSQLVDQPSADTKKES